KGENMDIVEWDEDPAVFIANSLNPAQVEDVIFDIDNPKVCTVVVPDYQLSLAIGKRGQNARLAAKLTAHKIDIKSESDMEEFYANYDESEVEEIVTEIEEITSEVEAIETEVEDIESEAEVTVDNMIEDEENIASDQTDQ